MSEQQKGFVASAPFALAIHGGAGRITARTLPPDAEAQCREVLSQVLEGGHAMLSQGASSLEAVEFAVRALEDAPQFNAGRGACFTHEGRNELDAAIMDGRTGRAGAVAGVTTLRHPVSAARAVMERSPHVLLIGAGAEAFAQEQALEIVAPSYFYTQSQFEKLEAARRSEGAEEEGAGEEKWGTVGAVALDGRGDVAAATSTGGMVNKRYGRVGDSPIIGAGTYASNATCAVSCTGHGEYFLRQVAAYDIAALMEYRGLTVREATDEVVLRKLARAGGEGGAIAVDGAGRIAIAFSTPGMYRASVDFQGQSRVEIFRSERLGA